MRWCPNCKRVQYVERINCPQCNSLLDNFSEGNFLGFTLSGRYQIVRFLSRGGMGAVYEGKHLKLNRRVAIKILMPKGIADERLMKRFIREAQIVAKLHHPNIVEVMDFDVTEEGLAFLVMEFLDGESFREILRQYPLGLPYPKFRGWFEEICLALEAAHKAKVIHRDLKPENIMISPYGDQETRVKLLDFGLARLLESTASLALTGTSEVMGTPFYMSPEQITCRETDARTDIYALGIIVFEMLTGKAPFTGDTYAQVIQKHLNEKPPDIRSRCSHLDAETSSAIERALAKAPEDRWPTVRAFRNAFPEAGAIGSEETVDMSEGDSFPKPWQGTTQYASSGGKKSKKELSEEPGEKGTSRFKSRLALLVGLLSALLAIFLIIRTTATKKPTPPKPEKVTVTGKPSATGKPLTEAPGWRQFVLARGHPLAFETLFSAGLQVKPQVLLFSPSLVHRLTSRVTHTISSPIPVKHTYAGKVDCPGHIWLLHEDRLKATRWDPSKNKAVRTVSFPAAVRAAVCLDPYGKRWGLLVARPAKWLVWNSISQQTVKTIPLDQSYAHARIDPSYRRLALWHKDGLSIRNARDLSEYFHVPVVDIFVTDVASAWSPRGRFFAIGFRRLYVYDIEKKALAGTFKVKSWIMGIGWLGNNALSVVNDRGRFYFTTALDGLWQSELPPPSKDLYKAFWITGHNRWIIIARNGTIIIRSYRSHPIKIDLQASPVELWSIGVHPRRPLAALSGKSPRISLVDLSLGRIVGQLEGHTDGVPFVRFISPERILSVSDDSTMRLWDLKSRKVLKKLKAHRSLINAFAVSPERRWLVTVSSDFKVKAWDLKELRLVKELESTRKTGAALVFLKGRSDTFLISDYSGSAYLYRGTPPNWKRQDRFKARVFMFYMLCPAGRGFWGTAFHGEDAGLWYFPANNIKGARRVSTRPAFYCHTSSDGHLTAVSYLGRVELRSNRDRRLRETFYFPAARAESVALLENPPMVLTGTATGRLMGWQLKKKSGRGNP